MTIRFTTKYSRTYPRRKTRPYCTWRMSRKRQGLRCEVLTAEHTNRRLCLPELMPCSLTGSVSGEPVTSISNVEREKKA